MSEAVVVSRENIEAARSEVAPIAQAADALVITNVDQHRQALEMLGRIMAAVRRVKALFAPSIDAATESKRKAEATRQQIVMLQDSVLESAEIARKTISEKCAAFEAEERKAAALIQEQLQREALAKQQEERELEAAMAETEDQALDAMTAPLPPPPVPVVRPEVAKVAGVSTRELWGHEIVNKSEFLAWAAKPENNFYADPNIVALNSRARAEKAEMKIPGVKAVSKLSHAGR